MGTATPDKSELIELESLVVDALASRDDSKLNVLGYGEVSVALGWPIKNPSFVCKRTPPFTNAQFASYQHLVTEYIERVEARGLSVAKTTMVPLDRGGTVISYLVQPMLDASSLGHNVLKASEPDPDHPFLAALAEALNVVTSNLSIDAQVTNFGWDGSELTLVDVGTPFLWDDTGKLRLDMTPFVRMLPAVTRALAVRELNKLVTRWNDPRRVAIDIVANLYREGLPEWVDPAAAALNRQLGANESFTAKEAREFFQEDIKVWPALKKAQAAERWWRTSIRRQHYDWFIYSSFEER